MPGKKAASKGFLSSLLWVESEYRPEEKQILKMFLKVPMDGGLLLYKRVIYYLWVGSRPIATGVHLEQSSPPEFSLLPPKSSLPVPKPFAAVT